MSSQPPIRIKGLKSPRELRSILSGCLILRASSAKHRFCVYAMQIAQPRLLSLCCALLSLSLLAPAQAATYQCMTNAMRGNKWICKEDPSVCSFVFTVNEKSKSISRHIDERNPRVPVVIDKWEDNVLIAHEDQTRIDSRFIEQYYYKIEFDSGNFLMANEYVTSNGRYLTQEELNMADKKKYSYYRPRLFSEKGRCTFKR